MTPSGEVVAVVLGIFYMSCDDSPASDDGSLVVEDPEKFCVRAQVFIGEAGDEGGDSFDLLVCSPTWFAARPASAWVDQAAEGLPDEVIFGSGWSFMLRWDQEVFERALNSICAEASPGPDWGSVATRISRELPWEYDYRYDEHVNKRFGEPFPPPRRDSK